MWTEVLVPVLMPAIRMAVSSALRGMVQTLNQVLEQSLSLRSWRWRVEAWRTGKTFAEVVLLRTLVYRVEQLLLVDRRAGLLLASVSAADIVPRDNQLVSAMLTALQDFAKESFEVSAEDGIRGLHVGDFSLLVETGPRAALAAAVRGNAPAELRETLRAAIDLIHQEFVTELRDFHDDAAPFERSTTILEGCLQAQYQKQLTHSYTKLWVLSALLLLALTSWIGFRVRDARRWDRAVASLRNAPGIAVTQSDRRNGRYILQGLYDPLASRPGDLLTKDGIDLRKVSLRFQPYISLDPELVVKRARAAIDAPETVSASLDKRVLNLTGAAPHSWILQARTAGPKLIFLGISSVEVGALRDEDMETLRGEIESAGVFFKVDSSLLTAEQIRAGNLLAAKSRQWIDYASGLGRAPRLIVLGYADPTGGDERSLALSRERAEHLAELLLAAGIPHGALSVEGRGKSTDTIADPALQRQAVVRPTLSDAGRSGQ